MSTETEILTQLALVATPSFVAFFIAWKILVPWSDWWLNKRSNNGLKEKIEHFEQNDLHECKEARKEFQEYRKMDEERYEKLSSRIDNLGQRLSRIEGRFNNKTP